MCLTMLSQLRVFAQNMVQSSPAAHTNTTLTCRQGRAGIVLVLTHDGTTATLSKERLTEAFDTDNILLSNLEKHGFEG